MSQGYGFLLLTSCLGNPERKPLTIAQLRILTQRLRRLHLTDGDSELEAHHLVSLGYSKEMAEHIVELMGEKELLEHYLQQGRNRKCIPITRQSPDYPVTVRRRLGAESPGCLWIKGNPGILKNPAVALVGSRMLREENKVFAAETGRRAALQGLTLVSGNAKGADRFAQDACLEAGGTVISVVADALHSHIERENVLYISEEDYDAPFSSFRALRRNRIIHALGWITVVAQCTIGTGGTWKGTTANLENGWSSVYCFRDGSDASLELEQRGASLIDLNQLADFAALADYEKTLFD